MKRKAVALSLIILQFIIYSCVSNPFFLNRSEIDRTNEKVAILPFHDYNGQEGNNSGELVRTVFESQLVIKRFGVIEIEKTAVNLDYTLMKKQEFNAGWVIEAGKSIGADYFLYGSVHDYRTYQNMTSFLYFFSWLEVTSSVGVTARMVSCKTGRIVWSGSYTAQGYNFNDATVAVVRALIGTIKVKEINKSGEGILSGIFD